MDDMESISEDDDCFGEMMSDDSTDVGLTYSRILAELDPGQRQSQESSETKHRLSSDERDVMSCPVSHDEFIMEEIISEEEEGEVSDMEDGQLEEEGTRRLQKSHGESVKTVKEGGIEMDEEPNSTSISQEEQAAEAGEMQDSNLSGIPEDNGSSDSSEDEEESKSVNADEIDSLLEEGLPEDYQRRAKPKFSVKELVIMEEKGKNSLEALPEGWLEVRHCSGIPIYLHRKTRVCTLAKPYSLGPSSVRKHLLPLSGIPCLSYRRALEKEEREAKAEEQRLEETITAASCPAKKIKLDEGEVSTVAPPLMVLPAAKVETAEETNTLFTVQPDELREYCKNLFRFRTIQCKRFKNWNAKRKHTKMQKRLKVQRPTLPDGVKLIKFPVKPLCGNGEGSGRATREYVLNPKGKSSVCILHEYVQHALRQQPNYTFKELEHASTPYSATVSINGIQYGTGFGTSKKQAKSNAARETLEVLIPEIKDSLQPLPKKSLDSQTADIGYTECFGQIELDDPRIATLCQNISEPTPYSLLLTCIQRNYGKPSEGALKLEMKGTLPNQKIKFEMTFQDHLVEVIAPNKKEGKQVASQMMLAKIHPHIKNFGAFIRLYGNDSIKSCKEKKQDQQEVTELQSKASVNSPNFAILAKLREEMRKLCEQEQGKNPESPLLTTVQVDSCKQFTKETQTDELRV